MLSSGVLIIGCVAFIAISIWAGSYFSPNRSRSNRSPAVEDPMQTGEQPTQRPVHFDHLPSQWIVHGDSRPVPDNSPLGFRPVSYHDYLWRRRIDEVIQRSWNSAPPRSGQIRRITTRALVESWRSSIRGLIALSDSNLKSAEEHLRLGHESTAVQFAHTAVENMARALIHCCGGKPDSDKGQEEALRMLPKRFKQETQSEFNNALDKLPLMSSGEPKQALRLAAEITGTFRQIVIDSFWEEIGNHTPLTKTP